MKIKSKHIMIVVAIIGVFMMVSGVAQAVWKFPISDELVKNGSSGLLLAAAVLFLYGTRLRKSEAEERADFESAELPDKEDKADAGN